MQNSSIPTLLITGASKGVGYATALLFANNGYKVIAISRSVETLLNLNHDNIISMKADITAPDFCIQLLDFLKTNTITSVDVVINNAAQLLSIPFLENTLENITTLYATNVIAPIQLVQTIYPFLKKADFGQIINITSMGGVQGSSKFNGLSVYTSTKAALINLTECWAEEFKADAIHVNSIALGAVDTEMLQNAFPVYKTDVTPDSIAAFIYFFVTYAGKLMNGKTFPVSKTTP